MGLTREHRITLTEPTVRADGADLVVEMAFASELPYERWWGVEILGHDRGECDLGWVASGRAPFLKDHRTSEQIGVVSRAWLDTATRMNRCVARFGRTALDRKSVV